MRLVEACIQISRVHAYSELVKMQSEILDKFDKDRIIKVPKTKLEIHG